MPAGWFRKVRDEGVQVTTGAPAATSLNAAKMFPFHAAFEYVMEAVVLV